MLRCRNLTQGVQHVWAVGRYSHKKLQIGSILACGLISATLGLCQVPWQIIALRGLTGVVAIGSVLNVVVLGDLVVEQTKEKSISGSQTFLLLSSNVD